MSRIGAQPIPLTKGVNAAVEGNRVTVKGPKGSLAWDVHPDLDVSAANGTLQVQRPSDEKDHKALHGLTRSLLVNMVVGVTEGFAKSLELVGVGYRLQQTGPGVTLSVMLSHPVEIKPRDGITLEVEGNNRVHVRGIDKQAVGQVAAEIRAVRPPNIYTGKGIRYLGEQVRLKPGKSARRVA